jgi:tetratricopeptide (TPR) repeat protein
MRGSGRRLIAGAAALGLAAACAAPLAPVVTTPRFPAYPMPEVPATLQVGPIERAQHERAWQWLQAGDPDRAIVEFSRVLGHAPGFYPAQAGLGFAYLADRQYSAAAERFARAVAADDGYVPAWVGQAEAQIALGRDAEAIAAMKRILTLDPSLTDIQSRLDLMRFRQVQSLIEEGRQARLSGRLDDARRLLADALTRSPASTVIMLELTLTEVAAQAYDAAEQHVRRAIEAQPNEAEAHAMLGSVLEAQGRHAEAAAAYDVAVSLDPRPEWRARSVDLARTAQLAGLPPEFGAIEGASTLTRAQVAAFIGIRLKTLVERAPRRVAAVATDVRTHWAEPWILPVTQTGIMDIFANHTFEPSAVVRRSDLAQVAVELVTLAGSNRPADLARWLAERPEFEDVSTSHLSYRPAALAVAAGTMATHEGRRFDPTSPATGADLAGVVARVAELVR